MIEFKVTELELLYRCRYKYKLLKELKLSYKTPPELVDDARIFGTILHNAFKHTLKPLKGKNIEPDIVDDIVKNFIEIANSEKIHNKIKELFKNRIMESKEYIKELLEIYDGSKINGVEEPISMDINDLKLTGRYDLMLDDILIDIKTSGDSILTKNAIEQGNIQIPLYMLMLDVQKVDIWHLNYLNMMKGKPLIERIGDGKYSSMIQKKRLDHDEVKKIAENILDKLIKDFKTSALPLYSLNPQICYVCELKKICKYGRES